MGPDQIWSGPEAIKGGQAFDRWVRVGMAVDFGAEIMEFIVELLFASFDPSRFGPSSLPSDQR
jgi:hypothetical protein